MIKQVVYFTILVATFSQYCPSSLLASSSGIFTGTFVVGGSSAAIGLQNGQDITCYNYTLNTPLSGTPSVATAINGFGVNPSSTVYFSVRPLLVQNPVSIPFQVRTQWKYAYWSSVSVNFMLETRTDIDAGTRIIDAGLSPCSASQSSSISLYFAVQGSYTNVFVFLSGFEASTSNSVIDMRITGTQQSGSGFTFQVSTQAANTITTVWVGYVAYSTATSSIQYIGSAFSQQGIQSTSSFPVNTQIQGPAFFGLSGISFNSNSGQGFSASFGSSQVTVSITTGSLNYLSANYIIFSVGGSTGSGCNSCQGFPYVSGSSCVASCPSGTYLNNGACTSTPPPPSNPCSSIPNSTFNGTYCICNQGYVQNGGACVQQSGTYNPCSYIPNSYFNGQYCLCSQGFVQQGSSCVAQTPTLPIPPVTVPPVVVPPTNNPCGFIPNSFFNGTACQCSQGYTQSGSACIPAAANNPCSFIPNSNYNGYSCVCNSGYVQNGAACVLASSVPVYQPPVTTPVIPNPTIIITPSNPTNGPPTTCPQGTFLLNRVCQNCPKGCAVCSATNTCVTCQNGFTVNGGVCTQICGKGFRVYSQCDDGNTISGDGCSSNCTIETGWTCSGGSPNTPDKCTYLTPTAVVLTPTGQVHTFGNIYANVRVNFLPTALSQNNCSRCNQNILIVNLTSMPFASPKITTSYVKGSSYTFSIRFQFPGEPIPEFSATAQLNPAFANTFFAGTDISQVVTLNINPAVMALQDNAGQLSLP